MKSKLDIEEDDLYGDFSDDVLFWYGVDEENHIMLFNCGLSQHYLTN